MNVEATFFMRVYNVDENLLRRAVESVLNQTESRFRFIIQDNGSTDGSKQILEEYAQLDNRIEVFRNEINSSVTYEEELIRQEVLHRNFIECDSKYFAFIDSDDYYEPKFLEKTLYEARKKSADIVFCGYTQVYDGRRKIEKLPTNECGKVTSLQHNWIENNYFAIRTLWGKLYSRKFWKDYWSILDVDRPHFMRSGLDTYIVLSLIGMCEKVSFFSESMYVQTVRSDSIYRTDLRVERILEADVLFLKGIELAQYSGCLNENTLTFLASVYYYHLEDVVQGLLKSNDNKLIKSAKENLEMSNVFNMLVVKNSSLKHLKQMIDKGV